MVNEIHISSNSPSPPPDAEFAIQIGFKKGEGNPQRVFKVAAGIISSFQRLDRILCNSIDNNIEPILMLEDIESGSIKIWLRNKLTAIDDQAIKDLDWKPAVGKYLVRAKYVYIKWSNKDDNEATLSTLAKELKTIASETDIKHIPDYAPPSLQNLATITKEIDDVKGNLIDGDTMQYIAPDCDPVDFDLTIHWTDEELDNMVVNEISEFKDLPMNLILKKPDYLGESKWEFRHGKKPIFASITDESWLKDFHDRTYDIRPGDALKCLVTITNSYGYDHELIKETYTVTKVDKILVDQPWYQARLIEDDKED